VIIERFSFNQHGYEKTQNVLKEALKGNQDETV
jgi:hypothetical protein